MGDRPWQRADWLHINRCRCSVAVIARSRNTSRQPLAKPAKRSFDQTSQCLAPFSGGSASTPFPSKQQRCLTVRRRISGGWLLSIQTKNCSCFAWVIQWGASIAATAATKGGHWVSECCTLSGTCTKHVPSVPTMNASAAGTLARQRRRQRCRRGEEMHPPPNIASCHYIPSAITAPALMTGARAQRPPPLRSGADGPPRVGPRREDPAPFVAAASFRTRPCFRPVQSSLRRRGRRPR